MWRFYILSHSRVMDVMFAMSIVVIMWRHEAIFETGALALGTPVVVVVRL